MWSNEKPTKPGWYWWGRNNCEPMIVKVFRFYAEDELSIMCVGTDTVKTLDLAHESGRWIGPLEVPSKAKE